MKRNNKRKRQRSTSSDTITSENTNAIHSEYNQSSDQISSPLKVRKIDSKNILAITHIEKNPSHYIGISKNNLNFLTYLISASEVCLRDLYICLRKIRRNETLIIISDQFQLNTTSISKILNKNIPIIAAHITPCIIWPDSEKIKENLLSQFLYRFKNVEAIIDCFGIEIQKPENPVKQSQTWSNYKQCNTCKYLITATPNGCINFVLDGYAGRTTDMTIVVKIRVFCNFLRHGTTVLANRGLKNLDSLLYREKVVN